MPTSEEILDLLVRWDEHRRAGRPVPVEELCADRPELTAAVRERIAVLDRMRWLDEPDGVDELTPDTSVVRDGASPVRDWLHGVDLTREDFRQRLLESRLLTPEDLAELERRHVDDQAGDSAAGLAEVLVAAGRVTHYQARAIAAGRERQLVLGNYVILDRLGQGGMGQVLKARHRRMDRLVALKMLPEHALDLPEALARFHREVRAAARLNHPHIVTAFDADEHCGTHFLVMELVDGLNLAELVQRQGPLSVTEALECVRQAGEGLAYAHAQGIVHRDVKPANLLLDRQGVVRVLDLGLARLHRAETDSGGDNRLTAQGLVIGTVDYMSPEQAQNTQSADVRSDVYSLGCTLFHLLTGRPPYAGGTLLARMLAHRDGPIPSLRQYRRDAPGALDEVLRGALAKKPGARFPDVASFVAQLDRFSTDRGDAARARLAARLVDADFTRQPGRTARDTSSIYSADTLGQPWDQSPAARTAPQPAPVRRVPDRRKWFTLLGVATAASLPFIVPRLWSDPAARQTSTGLTEPGAERDAAVAESTSAGLSAASELDRAAAEWALSIGARVEVFVGRSYHELEAPASLPGDGPIRLQAIEMREGMPATDADLARLDGLKSLITLGCYGTAIDDDAGPHLAALDSVEQLGLGKTRVTDAVLVPLARLPNLRHLRLGETAITDDAIDHLARFPALEDLDLSGTRVSAASVERLSRQLPHCRIVSNHGVIEGDHSRRTGPATSAGGRSEIPDATDD